MAWNIRNSRRALLTSMASMFFVMMLFFSICILKTRGNSALYVVQLLDTTVGLCAFAMMIWITVCGFCIFHNMKTKQQRIMFKMLPASNLEKFLTRYIFVFVLWTLGAIVAFCVADVMRILICIVTGTEWVQSSIPLFFKNFDFTLAEVDGTSRPEFGVTVLLWGFWVHTTYLLGGVLFSRKQFVFTSAFLFALGFIVSWVLMSIHDNFDFSLSPEECVLPANILSAVFAVLIVFNYWLSFRLFKRMQVINNKWINL